MNHPMGTRPSGGLGGMHRFYTGLETTFGRILCSVAECGTQSSIPNDMSGNEPVAPENT